MLPAGYKVAEKNDNSIVIAMTDYMLMFEDCKPTIEYEGTNYVAGDMTVIPREWIGHACSFREYNKEAS